MEYPVLNLIETGKRIKELREARNISIEELCIFLGDISLQAVYKWQRGDSLPDLGNMIRLMQLFRITDIREIVVMTGSADEALPVNLQVVYQVKHRIDIA